MSHLIFATSHFRALYDFNKMSRKQNGFINKRNVKQILQIRKKKKQCNKGGGEGEDREGQPWADHSQRTHSLRARFHNECPLCFDLSSPDETSKLNVSRSPFSWIYLYKKYWYFSYIRMYTHKINPRNISSDALVHDTLSLLIRMTEWYKKYFLFIGQTWQYMAFYIVHKKFTKYIKNERELMPWTWTWNKTRIGLSCFSDS